MSSGEGLFFSILAVSVGLWILITLISVGLYILSALGLYKLAQNKGIENPWLAWIPVVNLYILGKIINNLKVWGYDIPYIEVVLPVGCLVVYLLNNVPVIGFIASLAYVILTLIVLYRLYRMYKPDSAVLWIVLSIIIPFIIPIFIFIIRNNPLVEA